MSTSVIIIRLPFCFVEEMSDMSYGVLSVARGPKDPFGGSGSVLVVTSLHNCSAVASGLAIAFFVDKRRA